MNAATILNVPVDRLTHWLRGNEAGAVKPDHRRAQFDAIGDFLFAHGLAPTAEHFALVQRYLGGADARLTAAMDALLQAGRPITDHDLTRLESVGDTREREAEMLRELACELQERVGECIGAISESFMSTREYSQALDRAAADLHAAPEQTYGRLISLTLDVAETTRKISGRMEAVHADTQRLESELDRARRAAAEDHLTGLLNRRGFLDRLELAVVERPDAPRTIALCDIDDFKVVNDRHGHDVGDRVLTYVARQLRDQLGDAVMVARYGGEEFACLFEDMSANAAAEMLDRVRETLRSRALRDQHSGDPIGTVTFSAGLARIGAEIPAAFRDADAALYAAKHEGKDRVLIAR